MPNSDLSTCTISLSVFSENKHFVIFAPVLLNIFGHSRAMMVFVPELNDVEAQTVYIEMNVALLEIGSDGFPYAYFGVHCFYGLPCCLADALAMCLGIDKEDFQFALRMLLLNLKNQTAHHISVTDDAVSLCLFPIHTAFDGLP